MSSSVTGYVLPLKPYPQRLTTLLNGVSYNMRTRWSNMSNCWMLDLADVDNNPMVGSIPLVTGANLLSQYDYLGIGGGLYVYDTSGPPDAVPGFSGLGVIGFVAFIPYPATA